MAIEIERKYLVELKLLPELGKGVYISQGYIDTKNKDVVRARVKGDKGFITLKGESSGISCAEFEYEIPKNDALAIIATMCGGRVVEKTRYDIQVGEHIWELDIFHGKNDGLVVAEIELSAEDEKFQMPRWVKEEVSGQEKYYNVRLLSEPYSAW